MPKPLLERRDKFWIIRSGKPRGRFAQDFIDDGWVGIGWLPDQDLSGKKMSALKALLREEYPRAKDGTLNSWAAQIQRFSGAIGVGHSIGVYEPSRRRYVLGTVNSGLIRRPSLELAQTRDVEWSHYVLRDGLSTPARNSLGSALTLFRLGSNHSDELRRNAVRVDQDVTATPVPEPASDEGAEVNFQEEVDRADTLIEDRLVQLQWDAAQELVAGILDAMGYRTRVASGGPDRGVDIFASPDGLGLQEPRIFVEVKHRRAATNAEQVRSFLGGRQPGDRCLYVGMGGFTKDARYEAERSSIPIRLVDLPQLRELLVEHYERLQPEIRALVPLRRFYLPVE